MEESELFKDKIKLLKNDEEANNNMFNLRIENKLSLRKKTINNILYNKRILGINSSDNNNTLKFKLKYDHTNIKFGLDELNNKYKLDFNDNEDELIITLASKYLKSENINDIKYGIFLTQKFIKRNIYKDLTDYINLLFIYELLHIIDKINEDKEIIFNILDIIVSYSFINSDINLSTILLSPNSYKIWEICFNLQNFEIFYALICIFNNIIQNNQIGSCNLIRSNFLQNNIFNFYLNESIFSKKDNEDKSDIFFHIIKDGITLFCNLLLVSTNNLDVVTKEEVALAKQKIINILIFYSNSNNYENHYKCIYTISLALEEGSITVEHIDKNNFIENILINKKFFDEKDLLFFLTKIFGNYIAYKLIIQNNVIVEIINFEANYMKICHDSSKRKYIFWTLSNILISTNKNYEKIFEIDGLLIQIFECLKNSYSFSELKEILYFFGVLLSFVNNIYFLEIEKNHLMDILLYLCKNKFENRVDLLNLCFQIFEIYLKFGKLLSENFQGRNLIKEKFDKLGGNDLLQKYINYPEESLVKEINNIYQNYY